MRSDKIVPQYIFDRNYVVHIPDRDFWSSWGTSLPDDIICYMDGFKQLNNGNAGASVFDSTTTSQLVLPLGRHSTVYQAQLYAVLTCANSLMEERDAAILNSYLFCQPSCIDSCTVT